MKQNRKHKFLLFIVVLFMIIPSVNEPFKVFANSNEEELDVPSVEDITQNEAKELAGNPAEQIELLQEKETMDASIDSPNMPDDQENNEKQEVQTPVTNELNQLDIQQVENEKEQKSTVESVDSWMPDKNLQAAVAKTLKITVEELTKEQMKRLGAEASTGQITAKNVASLQGMEFTTGGTGIVLQTTNGTISDLSPIENVRLLQLIITNNNVSDLSPLKGKNLGLLSAENNNISDLSQLNFGNMKILAVDDNHISDLSMVPNHVEMLLARNQKIINTEIPKNEIIKIDSVKHVLNYDFSTKNFSNISNNGLFTPNVSPYFGSVTWENLDLSVNSIQYEFDRQYSFSTDSRKNNKVYYSGVVVQPFSNEIKAAPVTVKYLDEKGTELALAEVLTGKVGEAYEATEKMIHGWGIKEIHGEVKGIYTEEAQEVAYIYERVESAPVTTYYQDEEGNELATPEVLIGKVGEPYETNGKQVNGWEIIDIPGNANGVYTEEAQEVVYLYERKKAAPITVKYQDIEGNIVEPTIQLAGDIGEPYTAEKKEIEGYSIKEVIGNPVGVFSEQEQEILFIYKKIEEQSANIVVRYQDNRGNKIEEDTIVEGLIGEAYSIESKAIDGYTFKEAKGDISGLFSKDKQEVTFIYVKDNANLALTPTYPAKLVTKNSLIPSLDKGMNNKTTFPATGTKKNNSVMIGFIMLAGTILTYCRKKYTKIK
ncbi:cell wall anchor protein [Carnobacterium maltaromaticum]|uniref:MucBP domain-containing protein n=1 Tax=Carnobacterium maltaromaticum TaxID=2751 RepID=UPI000C78BA1E|nr:MucBP domain-containing protein [Carnobacterium maltaromaticum]PLS34532.1 cell wall anchor protein [Carnobacterium maltaromaticum]PLS35037.1 cell wall anchor protein [Carnobacterium maltaromaticum]PLS35450.1 cell wall anchor protein [Carnobacterium maltaromaticum]PLS42004.1 cell wall anchor protein [Carnobacterium maltaromaticum]PLS44839.1 cell wall anchor protein [Carnobacterium maltaromaticum]